ncbi:hypothetical protein [Streptomyces sp. TLI_053]|uniref:hypothetical protein n=1 Tax=Streptomyces sp. TLI_053 TaxID=1855352 RepID=UPI000B82D2D0|nr:hypothetical protein [Streptomyces sp. TLI_053]
MTRPSQQLRAALDALDTAFALPPEAPFAIGGCTHCYTVAELEALAGPAHLLPDDLVHSVAFEATDHWADFPAL